jgi:hypothetical protein
MATSAAKKQEEGSSDEWKEPSLEERLGDLNLQGEEEEDLDLSGEFEELVKEVRWLAIFRVHTSKPFSHAALFGAMRIAWAAAKEVTFKAVGGNLFLVQMHCLGDGNRLMDGGPWLFRGSAVVLEEYDGFSDVHAYKLDKILVWTRIQGVPDGLMKKKELAEKVASKVGVPITVIVNEGKLNSTTYLRARVWLQLNKPLVRVVPITLKERRTFLVQYEKIPMFCFHCGFMGHEVTECGDGVHEKNKCEWGDWLRVSFLVALGGRDDNKCGRGRGGGRGRGRGRGQVVDSEEDIEEMDTSNGEEGDSDAEKILEKGSLHRLMAKDL